MKIQVVLKQITPTRYTEIEMRCARAARADALLAEIEAEARTKRERMAARDAADLTALNRPEYSSVINARRKAAKCARAATAKTAADWHANWLARQREKAAFFESIQSATPSELTTLLNSFNL